MNGTSTTIFNSSKEDFIFFNPPDSTTNFGIGQATVQASMKNYPTIKSTIISFTATILGVIVPVISDQVFTLSSSALIIQYDPF